MLGDLLVLIDDAVGDAGGDGAGGRAGILRGLYERIVDLAPFEVELRTIESLETTSPQNRWGGRRAHRLCIAILRGPHHGRQREALRMLLPPSGRGPASTVIEVVREADAWGHVEDMTYQSRTFVVAASPANPANFVRYVVRLFREAELESWLASSMADSVSEMIAVDYLDTRNKEIEQRNAELEERSLHDALTGLANRSALTEHLARELGRVRRQHFDPSSEVASEVARRPASSPATFSVAILDLDHFKEVNDTHGHLVGDEVLRVFGALAREAGLVRSNDIVARYGGEEFCAVFSDTSPWGAGTVVERLRAALAAHEFIAGDDGAGGAVSFRVTASAGIAEFQDDDEGFEDVLARADEALYRAKNRGRNQVVIAGVDGGEAGE